MEIPETGLMQASRLVACALVQSGRNPAELYPAVTLLAYERTKNLAPLVFWAKWHTTSGIVRTCTAPVARYRRRRTTAARGMDVIFVQAPNDAVRDRHDHLLYGAQKARKAGAISIGLITNLRFYTDEQLEAMRPLIDWVLVPDLLKDQRERLDTHAPGTFFHFPYARRHDLYPMVNTSGPFSAVRAQHQAAAE